MTTTHTNDLRTLDQTRQRLLALTNALGSLQREIEVGGGGGGGGGMASWTNLTTSFTLLSHQLASLTTHLAASSPVLSSLHAYPLPIPQPSQPSLPSGSNAQSNEPRPPVWQAQETILTQLLRKKLDPETETWIDSALQPPYQPHLTVTDTHTNSNTNASASVDTTNLAEMSTWAADKAREIAGAMPWGSAFTVLEHAEGIRGVRTGLRRDLVADEDDDDDGSDDGDDDDGAGDEENKKDDDDGVTGMDIDAKQPLKEQGDAVKTPTPPMMVLEDVLRFSVTGAFVRRTVR